ncbi:MAG TPA: hypothetical protein VK465_01470 [Fibrobacteria bacterium]|nr:hypothetical protein [Fibrobacteria bacterium]
MPEAFEFEQEAQDYAAESRKPGRVTKFRPAFSWWKAAKKGLMGALVAGATAAALKAQNGHVKPEDLQAAFIAGAAGFIVMAGRNWMKNR